MKVQVAFISNLGPDRLYTYLAEDELGLEVGDIVIVPPTWVIPEPQRARVEAIGSPYEGPLTKIIGRAEA